MLDRFKLCLYPLCKRRNKVRIERDAVAVDAPPRSPLSGSAETVLAETVERIRQARCNDRPVVLAFGAHTIKNGLGPVLIALIERGWVTHLATNGAGIIHDWEFAFQGESSEDVRANVNEGRFGLWAETGFNLNLALILGARDGLGYGEAIGRLITEEEHVIPAHSTLVADVQRAVFVGERDLPRGHELVPGHLLHRSQDSCVFDPAALELPLHHSLAGAFVVGMGVRPGWGTRHEHHRHAEEWNDHQQGVEDSHGSDLPPARSFRHAADLPPWCQLQNYIFLR